MHERAPNRVLDLDEIESPPFRRVLQRMDELLQRESVSYLHPGKRWEYPWALERAALPRVARVLDAGCGASIFPIYLAEAGHRVTALDLSVPAGLDRLHGLHVDYVHGNLARLPFADGSFDAVFCISVIEHLGHAGAADALQELRRVTRPGGRVLVTTDYYEDAAAKLTYTGPGGPFPVEWGIFDEPLLRTTVLNAPGLRPEGEVDLTVEWTRVKPVMRRFHGYPYTSVGVCLVRGDKVTSDK